MAISCSRWIGLVALLAACGDQARFEACANGVDDDGDGLADCEDIACRDLLACAGCGNGLVGLAEQCDDGNLDAGDGCGPSCRAEACGDDIVQPGEACDDGNSQDGDGCDHDCTYTACGNGIVTEGEGCDDGDTTGDAACDSNCRVPGCGNGVVAGAEECDDGGVVPGDGCDAGCRTERCGNGVVQAGEQCDDANTDGGDGCDGQCRIEVCGDGILAAGEECEDGNPTDGDGCDSNCTYTACRNHVVTVGEDCDDGNAVDGDGCDSDCIDRCGDGIVDGLTIVREPLPCDGAPYFVAAGDLDGDGAPELVTDANFRPVRVFWNRGDGVYGDAVDAGLESSDYLWNKPLIVDFDDDGDGDIVSGATYRSWQIIENVGLRALVPRELPFAMPVDATVDRSVPVAAGDVDRDGDIDIIAQQFSTGRQLALGRNTGGVFGLELLPCADAFAEQPSLTDLDGDGWLDVVVDSPNGVCVLANDRTGHFPSAVLAGPPGTSRVADWDGDGDPDLVIASEPTIYIAANAGDGTFVPQTSFPAHFTYVDELQVGDIDGDGVVELVEIEVFRGLVARFQRGQQIETYAIDFTYSVSYSATIADLDGNGIDDLAAAVSQGNLIRTYRMHGWEVCDPSAPDQPPCTSTCHLAVCGDNMLDASAGEQCDDGGLVDGDGCDSNCRPTGCGNDIVTAGETCDDGNTMAGDGCNASCQRECGDGVVGGAELCDDTNFVDGDGCDSNCRPTGCGNDVVTAGEACDDGNSASDDGCSATCTFECAPAGAAASVVGANGHCYARFDALASWTSARATCEALGPSYGKRQGHLVTIADLGEDTIATSLVAGAAVWTGLHDTLAEAGTDPAAFAWVTDETDAFRRFLAGQPNNSGDQDCVTIEPGGGWADQACGTGRPYLCELQP